MIGRRILIAFVGLVPGARAQEPPSSLEPTSGPAVLHATYRKIVTTSCRLVRQGDGRTCVAERTEGTGAASVTLVPLRQASLRGRSDQRKPVSLTVSSHSELTQPIDPGLWRLSWTGHERSLRATSLQDIWLRLTLTAGHCELGERECSLKSSTNRRAELVDEAR